MSGIYAKIKRHKGNKVWYSLEFKIIAIGEESRWPCLDMARFNLPTEARACAEERGWHVVETWREAYDHAQIGPWDGVYRAYEPPRVVGPDYVEERANVR